MMPDTIFAYYYTGGLNCKKAVWFSCKRKEPSIVLDSLYCVYNGMGEAARLNESTIQKQRREPSSIVLDSLYCVYNGMGEAVRLIPQV